MLVKLKHFMLLIYARNKTLGNPGFEMSFYTKDFESN